ncbi:MAG TPA: hypothetical protein VGM81_08265 [Burkholderiaceae bacterium]|jgi:hypothetical protein
MMAIPFEILAAEVLALPVEQRMHLLRLMNQRLDWEQDWALEMDRREAAIDAGIHHWIESEPVVRRLRAQLT